MKAHLISLLTLLIGVSLAGAYSAAQAFPAPASGTMSLYQPGVTALYFGTNTATRVYLNEGWAAANTPVCLVTGNTTSPCQVAYQATEVVNFATNTGQYSGTLYVMSSVNIPGFAAPVTIAVAHYPMVLNIVGTSLVNGSLPFTGTLSLPSGNVAFNGTVYLNYTPSCTAQGLTRVFNQWCFTDGTNVKFGDVDVVPPVEKYTINF